MRPSTRGSSIADTNVKGASAPRAAIAVIVTTDRRRIGVFIQLAMPRTDADAQPAVPGRALSGPYAVCSARARSTRAGSPAVASTLFAARARRFRLPELAERGFERRRELVGRPRAPIVKEVHGRPRMHHVLVDRDDVEAVLPQRLQDGRDLAGEHRDVAGDRGTVVRADERRPGVEPHPRVDRRAHLRQLQIVATDRDLVHGAGLLAGRPDDL